MNQPKPTRVLVVAGARPNFVKVAPIIGELDRRGIKTTFVHTGQHYSAEMSEDILRDLELRQPDVNLGVGSGTHAQQTARVMEAFEPLVLDMRPRWVVVVGDVNSTLAAALVVAKLSEEFDIKLVHVEAGLRSGDWSMPEETNRVVTDRVADLLLTPSDDARQNLLAEGIADERIVFVGNVMIDSLLSHLPKARGRNVPAGLGVPKDGYVLVTLHRPSNVDAANTLAPILAGLAEISRTLPVVLPLHPRTEKNINRLGLAEQLSSLIVIPPVGYLDMLGLTDSAAVVMTDSGGLQEETTVLGVPCVTLRAQTERPITLTAGTNRMAPWPPTATGLVDAFTNARQRGRAALGSRAPKGWDGGAAARVADALMVDTR